MKILLSSYQIKKSDAPKREGGAYFKHRHAVRAERMTVLTREFGLQ